MKPLGFSLGNYESAMSCLPEATHIATYIFTKARLHLCKHFTIHISSCFYIQCLKMAGEKKELISSIMGSMQEQALARKFDLFWRTLYSALNETSWLFLEQL